MEEIKQEFIQNIVQEDIEFYYNLNPEPTDDLIDHCLAMAEELTRDYQFIYK